MSFDPISYAMGRKAGGGGGGGGGNPNTVVTVDGTLAEPFGALSAETIMEGISNQSVTALLTIYLPGSPATTLTGAILNNLLVFSLAFSINGSNWLRAASAQYQSSGVLALAAVDNAGSFSNITAQAGSINTTLTIINHPLP